MRFLTIGERWVRSVKQECLSKLISFGERALRRALQQYVAHYHEERNHRPQVLHRTNLSSQTPNSSLESPTSFPLLVFIKNLRTL